MSPRAEPDVFVLVDPDWGGYEVLGVYSSREKAEQAREELACRLTASSMLLSECRSDAFSILPFYIDDRAKEPA